MGKGWESVFTSANHKKTIRKRLEKYWNMFGHCWAIFIIDLYGNNMFKSSVIIFCFNSNLQRFDLLMGETETPHVYDFIFGDTRIPKTNQ